MAPFRSIERFVRQVRAAAHRKVTSVVRRRRSLHSFGVAYRIGPVTGRRWRRKTAFAERNIVNCSVFASLQESGRAAVRSTAVSSRRGLAFRSHMKNGSLAGRVDRSTSARAASASSASSLSRPDEAWVVSARSNSSSGARSDRSVFLRSPPRSPWISTRDLEAGRAARGRTGRCGRVLERDPEPTRRSHLGNISRDRGPGRTGRERTSVLVRSERYRRVCRGLRRVSARVR